MGQGVVDSQVQASLDDLCFGQVQKRCMNTVLPLSFNAGFGGQIGQLLKGVDELRPAVRIAGVVECVNPDKNVKGIQYLCPA